MATLHKSAEMPPARGADDLAIAVMVIDAGGQVVAGNPAARSLGFNGRPLVGQSLIAIFAGEQSAADPDFVTQQWRALRSEALDTWISRRVLGNEVRLRLERAVGGAGSYIATVLGPESAMGAH